MFLLKTEPSEYAFADLQRERRCTWTGVSNPGALIHLRSMRRGDEACIYHTGTERAIVGLAKATSDAYADPSRAQVNDRGEPRFAVVDLAAVRAARTRLTLEMMKADARFADFVLLRQGRLSVMPVPASLARIIRELCGF